MVNNQIIILAQNSQITTTYHFQWSWVTQPRFQGHALFDAEYLRNGTRL